MIKLNIPRISLPKKSNNYQSINQAYRSIRYIDTEKPMVNLSVYNSSNKGNVFQKFGRFIKSLFYANK